MEWKNILLYFDDIPSEFLKNLLVSCEFLWSPLGQLSHQIDSSFTTLENQGRLKANRKILANSDGSFQEGSY
jgi:hypothetical protein